MVVEAIERRRVDSEKVDTKIGQIAFNSEPQEIDLEKAVTQLVSKFVDLDNPEYSYSLANLNFPNDIHRVFQIIQIKIRRIVYSSYTVSARELEVANDDLREYMIKNMPNISAYLPVLIGQNSPETRHLAA